MGDILHMQMHMHFQSGLVLRGAMTGHDAGDNLLVLILTVPESHVHFLSSRSHLSYQNIRGSGQGMSMSSHSYSVLFGTVSSAPIIISFL